MARNRVTVILDAIDELSPAIKDITGKFTGLAVATTGAGAIITGALGLSARAAMSFESAMADVNKVLGVEQVQAYKVDDALLKLSRTIPTTAIELASIAAAGGQLGIAGQDIIAFTEQTAKMGIAFDMAADQAGESTAKLMNVFSLSVQEAGIVGDAINHLSNNSASTAADVVNAMTRIGGVARSFGLSSTESAALTSAFISLGNAPEVAATAIASMLPRLQTATSQLPKFRKALESVGISAEAMEQAVQQDASGAIVMLVQRLNALDATTRAGAINKMFGDGADARALATLANDSEQLTKALDMVSNTTQYAGSMQREFEARVGTSANGLAQLRNAFQEIQIHVGKQLLPAMNSLVGVFVPLVQGIASFVKENPAITRMGVAIAAVGGGLLTLIGSATLVVAAITPLIPAFTAVVGALLAIPFGPVLVGLAAIAAVGYKLYRNWATISDFFSGFADGFKTGIEPVVKELTPLIVWAGGEIQKTLQILGSWFKGTNEAAAGARTMGEAFGLMTAAVVRAVVELPSNVAQILGYLPGHVADIFNNLGAIVGSWITSIKMYFVNLGLDIRIAWAEMKNDAVQAIQSILSAIRNLGSQMFSAGADLIRNLTSGIQSSIGGATSAVGGFLSQVPVVGRFLGGATTPPIAGVAGNAAGGSLGSLISAAIAESRQMPSGSRLVVANSSEAILNRGQQGAIASSLRGGGGGTFAPQIVVNSAPGMNVEQLASAVMQRINELYRDYEAGYIA